MSRRDRISLVLGILGAIALVVYPLAHRISTQQSDAATPALLASLLTPGAPSDPPTVVTPAPTAAPTLIARPSMDVTWAAEATVHRGMDGETFEYPCAPDGTFGAVWGTDVYTDDSSVCTAAVHAGVITRETGGTVTIVILPGRATYEGSARNDVTTEWYGAWEGSYEFVESSP